MPCCRARVVALVLIAVQVIGGAWSFGAQVCLAGNEACGSVAAAAAAEAECCCGGGAEDEDRVPEPEPCGEGCGCCVQIPAPDPRGIEFASVREAELEGAGPAAPVCCAWAGAAVGVSRLVRPPPDVGAARGRSVHGTMRLQV